jgi:hypothetical protein
LCIVLRAAQEAHPPHEQDFIMLVSTTPPVTSIMAGGCIPPWITPTLPTEPQPWERGCWVPRNVDAELPGTSTDAQAAAGASLVA